MILGVSHITLTTPNIPDGLIALGKLGYRCTFASTNLPSHPAKQPFLRVPRHTHSLAYAKAKSGLPIELVQYESVLPKNAGTFTAIFGNPPPYGAPILKRTEDENRLSIALGDGTYTCCLLSDFEVSAHFRTSGECIGLQGAQVAVANFDHAKAFWCDGLGYRLAATAEDHGSRWALLRFISPIEAWRFTLLLVEATPAKYHAPRLEDKGMGCLSMICSNIESARQTLLDTGTIVKDSDSFEATINGQTLKISILEGPDRAFIELLQVLRKN